MGNGNDVQFGHWLRVTLGGHRNTGQEVGESMEHGKIQSNHQTLRQRQTDVRGRELMEEAK